MGSFLEVIISVVIDRDISFMLRVWRLKGVDPSFALEVQQLTCRPFPFCPSIPRYLKQAIIRACIEHFPECRFQPRSQCREVGIPSSSWCGNFSSGRWPMIDNSRRLTFLWLDAREAKVAPFVYTFPEEHWYPHRSVFNIVVERKNGSSQLPWERSHGIFQSGSGIPGPKHPNFFVR